MDRPNCALIKGSLFPGGGGIFQLIDHSGQGQDQVMDAERYHSLLTILIGMALLQQPDDLCVNGVKGDHIKVVNILSGRGGVLKQIAVVRRLIENVPMVIFQTWIYINDSNKNDSGKCSPEPFE